MTTRSIETMLSAVLDSYQRLSLVPVSALPQRREAMRRFASAWFVLKSTRDPGEFMAEVNPPPQSARLVPPADDPSYQPLF